MEVTVTRDGKFDGNIHSMATRSLDSGNMSKHHKRALSKNQDSYNKEKLMAIDNTNSRLSSDGKPNHNFLYN